MKDQILANIEDPKALEQLYRNNRSAFKTAFNQLYDTIDNRTLANYWSARLNYGQDEISPGSRGELSEVIILAVIAAFIAKIPALFDLNDELFYTRNIAFIVFPTLTVYFALRHRLPLNKLAITGIISIISVVFINVLPGSYTSSNTLTLSCIHLALFLWAVLGFTFTGGINSDLSRRLDFLKYNGDLVVMCTLILIAGGIMSAITIGLFSLIGLNIETFYSHNIIITGLAAVPLVGTYLTQTNPQLVGRVSPVIARLFSPLVVVMLVIYLVATLYASKDPYTNREFLLTFNLLLIGVLAIIFFSVAEAVRSLRSKAEIWILALLSGLTIIVNIVALSAILFRISEWGITPNRAAVVGGNVLILVNLVLVTVELFKVLAGKSEISEVGKVIASYLPVYVIWAAIVTFIFPFIFSFQ